VKDTPGAEVAGSRTRAVDSVYFSGVYFPGAHTR